MLSNRWAGLVGAMLVEACTGLSYTFAIYSEHLKQTLHYSQEDVDGLGAAKDFGGTVGLVAGLLYNFYPPWVTMVVGAVGHLTGYGVLWLTVTDRIRPTYGALCMFVTLAVGGGSWADTACVVTSMRNFPMFRGTVMGLLKSQVGLSGAVFTVLYKAFISPDTSGFLLLVAVLPASAMLLLAHTIRHFPTKRRHDDDEPPEAMLRFRFAYGLIVGLAVYLLGLFVLQSVFSLGRVGFIVGAIGMLVVLSLLAFLPVSNKLLRGKGKARWVQLEEMPANTRPGHHLWPGGGQAEADQRGERRQGGGVEGGSAGIEEDERKYDEAKSSGMYRTSETLELLPFPPESQAQMQGKRQSQNEREETPHAILRLQWSPSRETATSSSSPKRTVVSPCPVHSLTLLQSSLTLNFWLLFFTLGSGAGTGIAIINNYAQMGKALRVNRVEQFVGLISIWSCFGRLGAGYASDLFTRRGVPRPLLLAMASSLMIVTLFFLASGALLTGSILVGLSFGAYWSLVPAVASDLFGLEHFGAVYKAVASALPFGALILSAKITGSLYDQEVVHYCKSLGGDVGIAKCMEEHTCYGHACFAKALVILGGVCIASISAAALLTWRTQKFYRMKNSVVQNDDDEDEGGID
ncbi:hypothetical protein CBR_g40099 [Chara braunii]|uniref:Uncharacterized protein n=1 Tax=Chara braunii TaxID=69332 RepID=A0A388LT19_CHABU|nr:hypothetical protein CBR_g40099 [Chara braunii]|eukprot:GBG85457.1 hypothetical protein CBR_g40099 [Chara braunii]